MEGLRFKQEPGLLTLLLLTHVSLKHQSNIQCESHLSLSFSLSHTHIALLLKADIPKYLLVHAVSWREWIKVSFKLGKGGSGVDHGFGSLRLTRVWAYRCVPIVTQTRPWDFLVTPGFDFPSYSLRKTHWFFLWFLQYLLYISTSVTVNTRKVPCMLRTLVYLKGLQGA